MAPQKRPAPRATLLAAAGFALAIAALAAACGAEGTTPDCPPLDLYNVASDEAHSDATAHQRQAAVDAGCATEAGNATSRRD